MRDKISSKTIALQFFVFFASVIAILYYPFTLFFSGKWEAQSYVNLISVQKLLAYFGSNTTSIEEMLLQNDITSIGFRYYSLTLFIGVLTAFYLMILFFNKNKISDSITERLFIALVLFGLVGARLGFIFMNWSYYSDNRYQEIINFKAGGLTLYGGILASGLYLMYYCWSKKLNFRTYLDALVPSALMVMIWARFGNFFNYEAYGPATNLPWKMYVPEGAVTNNRYNLGGKIESFYHPTFLYEIILNIILFLILTYIYDFITSKRKGNIAGFMMIGYGVGRYFLEFYRLDSTSLNDYITFGQIFSIILVIIGIGLIITSKKELIKIEQVIVD